MPYKTKSYECHTSMRTELEIPVGVALIMHRNLIHKGCCSKIYNTTPLYSPRLFFYMTQGNKLVDPSNPPINECQHVDNLNCPICKHKDIREMRHILKDYFGNHLTSDKNILQYTITDSLSGDLSFLGWEKFAFPNANSFNVYDPYMPYEKVKPYKFYVDADHQLTLHEELIKLQSSTGWKIISNGGSTHFENVDYNKPRQIKHGNREQFYLMQGKINVCIVENDYPNIKEYLHACMGTF